MPDGFATEWESKDKYVLADQAGRKSSLAATAVSLIVPNSVVFIDAGSSNVGIADALPEMPLAVATNAPMIAALLADRPHIDLVMIGGRIDSRSGACLGATAIRDVVLLRPHLYVLVACGVDADAGVSAFDFDEAEFKRRVVRNSRATLVAATKDKLSTTAAFVVAPASQLTYLVVQSDVETHQTAAFSALGVQVVRASSES